MKFIPPDDLRSLERATSRSLPECLQSDLQTDALHEGWQLLSQLLEVSNAAAVDEASLVRQVRRRVARRQMVRRMAVAAMVSAVCLGGALWRWGGLSPAPNPDTNLARPSATHLPENSAAVATVEGAAGIVGSPIDPARPSAAQTTAELAVGQLPESWEDLDAEIEVAWSRLDSVRQDWRDPLTSLNWVGAQLDELEEDLAFGPL